MDDLMHDSSDEAIADVEAFLKEVKPFVAGWEADFGKGASSSGTPFPRKDSRSGSTAG